MLEHGFPHWLIRARFLRFLFRRSGHNLGTHDGEGASHRNLYTQGDGADGESYVSAFDSAFPLSVSFLVVVAYYSSTVVFIRVPAHRAGHQIIAGLMRVSR